jgi:hypothetical protein
MAIHLDHASGPRSADDMTINHRSGGPGFCFRDPSEHLLEVLTAWRGTTNHRLLRGD